MPIKALLLVDIQYDFLPPDGALAVPDGDTILAHIYDLLEHAEEYDVIVASKDWHPTGHISFASTHSKTPFTEISVPKLHSPGETISQMLWPDHCVQETHGSKIEQGVQSRLDALAPDKVAPDDWVIQGTHIGVDAYSAFADNGTGSSLLAKILHERKITEVDVVGLALDYCVKSTAISSREFGFKTHLLRKATKAVNPANEKDVLGALQETWQVNLID